MKVLWVSLVEFPPLSQYLGKLPPAHCGWLYSLVKAAFKYISEFELGVLVYSYGTTYQCYVVDGIKYYLIPSKCMHKTDKTQIGYCQKAIKDYSPDIIHIHGTEYSLAAAVCKANMAAIPMIANIQGLAIPYMRYADGGLSLRDKLWNITPFDIIRNTFILGTQKLFRSRAACEKYVLNNVTNVIGRTTWDHDHVLAVNTQLEYHFMNETLRDSFYEEPFWRFDKCNRYQIFVSNSGTALKGAHKVLLALPLILKKYPETIVHFCGSSVMNNDMHSIIRMQGYHLFLRRLVTKLGLKNNVKFLGQLSESEMKQEFLDANVYIMPSAIENSPNSLCEAQILGVPTVASYVGGVADLVEDGNTGFLYRYEEVEMLAQIIVKLFGCVDFDRLSANEKIVAKKRHDKKNNALRLYEIYQGILS